MLVEAVSYACFLEKRSLAEEEYVLREQHIIISFAFLQRDR